MALRVPLTSSVFVLKISRRSLCVPEENIVQKKILLTRKSEFFGPFHSICIEIEYIDYCYFIRRRKRLEMKA